LIIGLNFLRFPLACLQSSTRPILKATETQKVETQKVEAQKVEAQKAGASPRFGFYADTGLHGQTGSQ
jgi:hypothetical protein